MMLEKWFERMLGIEEAVAGEGTAWRLVPTYPWAPWLALVFSVLTLGFVFWIYTREGAARRGWKFALAGMRVLVIFVVAFAMLPGWTLSIERTGLPFVVVIVDDSASMSIIDRYDDDALRKLIAQRVKAVGLEGATRLNQAKAILMEDEGALLKAIEKRYRLKVYYLSEAALPQSGDAGEVLNSLPELLPDGAHSRLGTGVRTVLNDLRGASPTAIILLTDGITTEGEKLSDVAGYALQRNVRLLTVGLGSDQPLRDLELHDVLVDEVVYVDDIVNFTFSVAGTGFEGRTVEARLREKGKDRILAKVPVTIGKSGQSQQVRLPYRPREIGEFDYVVEIEPQDKEADLDNNRQQTHVTVRREQIKVLLVQAYPSYEYRYLKTMLEKERTIQLNVVLQEADPEFVEIDRTALADFPVSREKLFEYDVLLFGDVNPAYLSQAIMENVVDFVKQRGRGVLFFSGPQFTPLAYAGTPLARLLPIDLATAAAPPLKQAISEGFKPTVTDLGQATPHMQLGDTPVQTREIWRHLPALYWLLEAADVKPGARVLAEHPTKTGGTSGRKLPLICLQPVGAGSVLFHATDDTWRWRYQVGEVYFARYWVQAIRFLSRSKLVGNSKQAELKTDRREYQYGQPVRLRVRFLDQSAAPAGEEPIVVMVERGDTKSRLTLKRSATSRNDFEGTFSEPIQGSYHVWLASPTLKGTAVSANFTVHPPPGESERFEMDLTELKRAASDSKGHFFTFATADKLLDKIPPGRPVPVESLAPYPVWNIWPLLAVCLCLLVVEWIVRKRQGML